MTKEDSCNSSTDLEGTVIGADFVLCAIILDLMNRNPMASEKHIQSVARVHKRKVPVGTIKCIYYSLREHTDRGNVNQVEESGRLVSSVLRTLSQGK